MKKKRQKTVAAVMTMLVMIAMMNPWGGGGTVYAHEMDAAVIEQQSGEEQAAVQTENTKLKEETESSATAKQTEDMPATGSKAQSEVQETPKEETSALQPEARQKNTQNRALRSMPGPKAVGDVIINKINFPDNEFRAYVERTFDTDDPRGILTADEIAKAEQIHVGNTTVTDLTGIEYFTALKDLRCYQTGIKNLDLTKNTALELLFCYDSEVENLNITKNTALKDLTCYNTKIKKLDVSQNTALEKLSCSATGITSLDVSKNTALTSLDCDRTEITSLDVSMNTALTQLYCSCEGLESLDVSRNTALTRLNCNNTKITSLDVSKNTALKFLECYRTRITGLDVSKNMDLTSLICVDCPLAWLKVGVNLKFITKTDSTISLEVEKDTFNITDKFKGIDPQKVTIVSGANYNAQTGEMSNYNKGESTPIIYIYDCGTSAKGPQQLKVTLTVKGKSTIRITESLDKIYDGKAVKGSPAVEKTGSTGAVTYTWEKKTGNNTWETITSAPTNAGAYRVTASLASDDQYVEAKSEAAAFTIKPKNMEGSTIPNITEKTDLEHLTIKDGDTVLVQGRDYDITKTQDGNKVIVTITFKGNYSGTITKTYTLHKDKPAGSKTDTGDTGSAVQTGDTADMTLWTMLLAIAAGLIAVLAGRKRKTKIEDKEELK